MELSFKDQLILTITDKALIGGLVAIAGFWLNRYSEIFKSRQDLENELRKARDQKQLEILQSQLSNFYWPIYLRLQMDNVVWERILDRQAKDQIKRSLATEIETNFILPNHEATCEIIRSNIQFAASDKYLFDSLVAYVRHVTVYKALRSSGNKDIDPLDVGEPWPHELFGRVREATLAKQKDFDEMLKATSARPR